MHFYLPVLQLWVAPSRYVGIVPLLMGVVFLSYGSFRFIRIGTNLNTFVKPDILVTTGPFSVTRNPMYLGFLLVLIGNSVLWGSLTALAGPVIFFVVARQVYIPFEENRCREEFGEAYILYQKQVRRWF